jgi:hypothetical protein
MHRFQRCAGGASAPLAIMLLQLADQIRSSPAKPPVTLGLVALQVVRRLHHDFARCSATVARMTLQCHGAHPHAIAVRGTYLLRRLQYLYATGTYANAVNSVCFSAGRVLAGGLASPAVRRALLLSPLLHLTDAHLFYNMSSFLYKGMKLERQYGSVKFAALLVALALASQAATVGLAVAAAALDFPEWMYECGVGFSGVIFALKPLVNTDEPGHSNVLGFSVPTRHLAWAELLLAYVVSPNSSFVGHLGGLLAGIGFLSVSRALTGRAGASPLTIILSLLGVGQGGGGGGNAEHGGGAAAEATATAAAARAGTAGAGALFGSPSPGAGGAGGGHGVRQVRPRFYGYGTTGQRGDRASAAGTGAATGTRLGEPAFDSNFVDTSADAALAHALQMEEDAAAAARGRGSGGGGGGAL